MKPFDKEIHHKKTQKKNITMIILIHKFFYFFKLRKISIENFLNLNILILIFVQVIFCHINVKYFIQKTVEDIERCDGQKFFGFKKI